MKPAVVVMAHNRPQALIRLLRSVAAAEYPHEVTLLISVDGGGERETAVLETAHQFTWSHGSQEIIHHRPPLGLVAHYHFAGGLSEQYGAIIRLEDDYLVSRQYYRYAAQALAYYAHEPRLAGISLYALWFNGYTQPHLPFVPYPDEGDAFFMQLPWSQGQAYTAAQWAAYNQWHQQAAPGVTVHDPIHEIYATFPPTDWFPLKTKYLAETGRYYLFPRESHVTNFGDAGTHFAQASRFFQVPLQDFRRSFRFGPLATAVAVYDSYQEMLPDRLNRLNPDLAAYDYEVDLYGTKSPAKLTAPFVLTGYPCRQPQLSFGRVMWPQEANIAAAVSGHAIHLCSRDGVDRSWLARQRAWAEQIAYFRRGHLLSGRQQLRFWLGKTIAAALWRSQAFAAHWQAVLKRKAWLLA
jgi:hypothetical protein